jgi:hypothetical protein
MTALCADDDAISPVLKCPAHNRFAGAIHARRVEKIDTTIDGCMQQVNSLPFGEHVGFAFYTNPIRQANFDAAKRNF